MTDGLQARREQIIKLRNSDVYRKLDHYYRKKSFFNILNIARKETVHSDFLAWLLNPMEQHGLGTFGLAKLLETVLIVLNRFQANAGAKFPKHLEDIIVSGNYALTSVSIRRERSIGTGVLDLFAECIIHYEEKSERLVFILENKVKSKEGDNQTLRYYEWCEEHLEGNKIYIYLTPLSNIAFEQLTEPECLCENFIQLNYQYLVDYIIEPCRQRNIRQEERLFIDEYLRTLSYPALQIEINEKERGDIIMALCEKERELLRNFWSANQELLIATLTALRDDPELPEEEREEISSGLDAIISVSSKDFTRYRFKGEVYPKNRLILAVLRDYVEGHPGISSQELERVFPYELQGNQNNRVFVQRKDAEKILEDTGHRRHFIADDEILQLGDKEIAVCNQWGKPNITKFIKQAKELGYVIEEA